MPALQWAVPLALFAGAIAGALLAMAFRRRPRPPAVAAPPERTERPNAGDGAFVRLVRALPIGIVLTDAQR
ncbi:MAG: hypothetical protein WCD38_06390, partial [Candidatus Tumulicola sp.]